MSGFYQWSRGVQIRANLDLLMDWVQSIGLADLATDFFQKLSAAVNLLATPKETLLQVGGRRPCSLPSNPSSEASHPQCLRQPQNPPPRPSLPVLGKREPSLTFPLPEQKAAVVFTASHCWQTLLTAVTNDAVKVWDKAAEEFRLTVAAASGGRKRPRGNKVAAGR